MIRVLGIDPGLANTGVGIIDVNRGRYIYRSHSVISTPADKSPGDRLQIIYSKLEEIIEEYRPDEAGIESLFFSKNITSALPVAQAKGVVLLLLAQNGIPAAEYPPQAIKQSIVGRGRADKNQVRDLIRILLGMNTLKGPDHATDALAAAVCHYNHLGMRNFTNQERNSDV